MTEPITDAGSDRAVQVALHTGQLLQPVPGGIGRYARAMLRHLPPMGVDLTAFAAGPKPGGMPQSVPYVDLGWPRGSLRYEMWHRARRPTLRVKADVVHAPSLAVPPVRGRPLIVTVHDIAFVRLPRATTRRGVAFHRRGLQLARDHAQLVIAPSLFTRDELLLEGFAREQLRIAPLGCDPPDPLPDEVVDTLVRMTGVRSPFVLSVGTVEPRKDLGVAADAITRLRATRDVTLVIVGPPGWGEVGGLDRPGVRRLGPVRWEILDSLYRRARACCLPSTYEGFGLPAAEALARGCPVVASGGGAMAEIVGDAGVLCPAGDVDAFSDALARIIDDDDLHADLARRGPLRAAQFSWSSSAARHAEVYREAIEQYR
jgi:glycosyltransferase involved in cell wall biosynthesis